MYNMLKDKILIVENTYYSLLLYVLSDTNWEKRDYVIINERISSGFISRLKNLVNSVLELDYFPRVRVRYPIKSILQRKKFLKFIQPYDVVYGNIYELKMELVHDKEWFQIDDGEFTYLQLAESYDAKIPYKKIRNSYVFRRFLGINYGFDFLTVNYLLPDRQKYRILENKYSMRFVDMKKAYRRLSDDNKSVVLKLFGLDSDLTMARNLILMQPLFTDGVVVSIDDEIEIYRYILKVLGIDECECVFKPHPASSINYQVYFPQSMVISNDFPSELLPLCDVQFDKVATLFSSGISAFSETANELYFFGNLWLKLPTQLDPYKIINGETTDFFPGG